MKACKIIFSLQLLLQIIGLNEYWGLEAYSSETSEHGDTFTLYLTGDHPDLPEIKIGDDVPAAIIRCEKLRSKIELLGEG